MLLPQSKRGGEIPPGTLAARACVSAVRLAGLARWHLPVGVFSPICLCTGVSSGRGALRASPSSSVCWAGILEAGGQGRPHPGKTQPWELSAGERGGKAG